MLKKNSRCLSCFSCFSATNPSFPDAEHIRTHGYRTEPNPSPTADEKVLEGGYSQAATAAAIAHHDEQLGLPINAPSVSSTSQPSPPADDKVLAGCSPQASNDVVSVEHHDEHVGLTSPSSSGQTVSNLINAIREDAETVKPELDALVHEISGLFEVIKTPKESQKETKRPISAGFSKSKDLLLETVRVICSRKDVLPAHAADKVAQDVVQGLGQEHWVTSGFLLIVYFLDRFETLSSNRERCLSLLEEMYHLAVDVKNLEGWEGLAKAERDGLAKDGAELIVKGSLICCNQMSRTSRSRFLSTSAEQDDPLHLKVLFDDFNHRMLRRMSTWICSSLFCRKARPLIPGENAYPDHAVGIDEPFNNVTKLLQWEGEERAVAVILHGFGGIGKTTLADAVFARYYVKDCKYSVVRLDSSPDIGNSEIVKLQKNILRDLMRSTEEGRTSEGTGDEVLDFDDFRDGRRKIGFLLKKEVAFLYIDNVLDPELFEKLLPASRKLKNAKKLRLLITARDINVLNQCNIKRGVHRMQTLSPAQAKDLLSKEMCNGPDDINGQITGSELDNLVEISGGVPKLLEMMACFILSEPDQIRESYRIVIEDSEKLTGDAFKHIDKYIFAYEDLPEECKNPFLDICYFFKGWEWETVANTVGESQLDGLERRALIYKDKDMICLNDVILTIGKVKARDTRFDFTQANADEIGEFFEQDMQYLELVKGLWFSDDEACKIPITKLNSMRNSLRVFGHKMQQEESFEKMELGEGQREPIFHELLVYKGESPHCPFKWSGLKKLRFLSYRPQNLEFLHKIPSSNLKHIELDGSLCSVREILSSDIQQLRALQVLRLINFHNLEKLPEDWGEYLRENLKELTLSNCRAMKQLTGSISQLTGLQILKLHNCCNLKQWPTGCESLNSSLKKIILCNCPILKSLPSCFVEALDSDSRRLFQHEKGMLSDFPQSNSESERRLSPEQAKDLLRKEMCNVPDDINGQITDSELDKLVETSGGVPKILEMMAGFIPSEPDKIRETVSKEQGRLPSASSSTQTVSNLINAIREDAETVKPELDALIHKISGLFELIETPKELQKETKRPISVGFSKSKDLLLETVRVICSRNDVLPAHEASQVTLDVVQGLSQVAQDVVQGLGQADWVALCFLLVSYILDQFETPSNRDGCWSLLKQMYDLAVDIKKLTGWEDLAQAGTKLIVEGSLICCSRFFSTSVDKDELLCFEEKILDFHERMIRRMPMWICSGLLCQRVRPPNSRGEAYWNDAVGIEEPFNNVTKLLQWEGEERAVAVILHGFGGIGKTTLADAVFARYYVKDCKYSVVRLESSPDIVKWQKIILQDLMKGTEERTSEATEGDEILDFEDYIVGRRKIGELLRQEVAFIYIDNVVDRDSLQKLLPTKQLKDAKKLRVLITTRDLNVLIGCNMKQEVYAMNTLSPDHGRSLLIKEMYNNVTDDINGQITDSLLEKIVALSGGLPLVMKVMAGLIQSAPDKNEAYRTLMQESEKLTGNTVDGIDKFIFGAYDDLPDECKNPFLDICYFFEGWEWETVANIVGESQLKVLESRSLVSRDNDMISLHDLILGMGKAKAQDTRFDFTRANAGQIEELFEKDMQYLELVKGLWFSDVEPCKIPLTKLNSMSNSLRVFGHKMQQEESFVKMELGEGQREPIFHELLVYKGESPHCPFKWSGLKKLRFLSYRPQNLEVLREIPSSNLKHIELDGSLCSVSEILSSDIQQLRALQVLRLINFPNLEKLPEEWGEYLRENLKELTLSNCTAMKQLPGSLSQLTGLQILKLDNCRNLKQWPAGCEALRSSLNLRFLSYQPQNLNVLKEIPSSNLKHIELDGSLCSVMEILSSDIQQLRALQVLRLINFHNLEKLPEEWGYLRENLKELTLSNCTAMKELPGSISQLTGLEILELDNCCNLEQWPEGCESLSSSLKKIILCHCPILKSLPSCFVEALDSDSRCLFQHQKGILSDSPQSNRDEE